MATSLPIPEAEAVGSAVPHDGLRPCEDGRGPTPTLASIAPGGVARVTRVDTSRPIGHRLVDLGFVPGTRVRVIRRAPLGDPVTYEVRGTRLCLRRSEALQIEVAPCDDTPAPRR